jgi:hypothetical protein
MNAFFGAYHPVPGLSCSYSGFAGFITALFLSAAICKAAAPFVTNVRASQSLITKEVPIWYNLEADSAPVRASLAVSDDGGLTWNVPAQSLYGSGIGVGVNLGKDRHILWNARADWPEHRSDKVVFRIIVKDDLIPPDMALIPRGVSNV